MLVLIYMRCPNDGIWMKENKSRKRYHLYARSFIKIFARFLFQNLAIVSERREERKLE